MLQTNDACSEWYEQSNPDVVNIFRSLHYTIEDDQPSYTLRRWDNQGKQVLKHPWAAHAIQYGGRESMVHLNINGPFFRRISPILDLGPKRWISPIDHTRLGVAAHEAQREKALRRAQNAAAIARQNSPLPCNRQRRRPGQDEPGADADDLKRNESDADASA